MAEPYVRFTPNYDWRNKHQNVRRRAARLYSVWNLWEPGADPTAQDWRAGLAGLRRVIRDAESLGRRLRPLGGSWSLSDVAACSDFLVDTKPLNMMTVGMRREHLAPEAQGRADALVFAQCGVSILELNRKLEGRGLSLKTSGASTGQTIAGALATGTHGSARDVGSIQEFVVGLHLCGEGGESVWVERRSAPIASEAFIAFLGATRVLRDDHLFRAAWARSAWCTRSRSRSSRSTSWSGPSAGSTCARCGTPSARWTSATSSSRAATPGPSTSRR
jgi:FAD/FMN-containing dehydrogenase